MSFNEEPYIEGKIIPSLAEQLEQEKAAWDLTVRSHVRMLPGYSVIKNPLDARLFLPNKKIKNPQDFKIVQLAQTLVGHHLIEQGVGLAAPQIGLNLRMCCVSILDQNLRPTHDTIVFFNPRVVGTTKYTEDNIEFGREACLSVPGRVLEVCRLKTIKFRASTFQHPKEKEYTFSGYYARIIAHEIAHLQGRLITMEGSACREVVEDNGSTPQS
jgi:peptide deformylase